MKALTVWQPWASLIANGIKHVETRSWPTDYRGMVAIHSALKKVFFDTEIGWLIKLISSSDNRYEIAKLLPKGQVLCTADLIDCVSTSSLEVSELERRLGDFSPGRWGWVLENVQKVRPVKVRGYQRLWNWTPKKGELIYEQKH